MRRKTARNIARLRSESEMDSERAVATSRDWRNRVSPVVWRQLSYLKASFRPYTISGTAGYGY